ncbi:MAG: arylesterase [Alphaproteobacteria bacterium]|nr:arylesterase [Alphaproteobacteria bacterium]
MFTLAAQAQTKRIIVFGDSLSAGFNLAGDDAFPAVLERRLRAAGHNVQAINAGVSGDTASAGLSRLEWATGDGAELVIVELGANDMLRGIDPDVTEKALDAIVSGLRKRGIPVLLAGMQAAPNLGPEFRERYNAIFPRIAARHSIPLYPFFLDGVATRRELNQSDGIHPNRDGVAEIVKRILPYVIKALVEQASGSK